MAAGAFPLLALEEVGDCLGGGCCLCGMPDAAALAYVDGSLLIGVVSPSWVGLVVVASFFLMCWESLLILLILLA